MKIGRKQQLREATGEGEVKMYSHLETDHGWMGLWMDHGIAARRPGRPSDAHSRDVQGARRSPLQQYILSNS